MIHDFLDLINPRNKFTATGFYYTEKPESAQEDGAMINYEYVDVLSRTYRRAFGNVQDFVGGEVSIRTADMQKYKIREFIKTQEGQLFQILQVATDYSAAPKQAFRIQGLPVGTQYVLRLVNIPDAWGE